MKNYALVYVNFSGYIMLLSRASRIVHRESRLPLIGETMYSRLADAKVAWENQAGEEPENTVRCILGVDGYTRQGCELWAPRDRHDELRSRLDKWKGCYGRWQLRVLNVPTRVESEAA